MIGATHNGRAGQPDDVAETAYFLASEGARHITGQTIHVNGGAHTTRRAAERLCQRRARSGGTSRDRLLSPRAARISCGLLRPSAAFCGADRLVSPARNVSPGVSNDTAERNFR